MTRPCRRLLAMSLFMMVILVLAGAVAMAASHTPVDWKGRYRSTGMKDIKVTVAALKSTLSDPNENLKRVENACKAAQKDGARLILLPECMLTGHGGHRPTMEKNAESVPEGPLSQAILKMSQQYQLCICVGIGERADGVIYNSVMVADKGKFLGVQRKIYLSSDEPRFFAEGQKVEVFDINDVRFGISICYDNLFPEITMIHKLYDVDLILAAHAARVDDWPDVLTPEFCAKKIKAEQERHQKMYAGTAYFYNIYVLSTNVVGSATEGIKGVVSNHEGGVFGVDPNGGVILRTSATDSFIEEVRTVELKASGRKFNHHPTRNRDYMRLKALLDKEFKEAGY